jgi:DNA topoisomerase-3
VIACVERAYHMCICAICVCVQYTDMLFHLNIVNFSTANYKQMQYTLPILVTPHTMITTSVRGHLAQQDFPAAYGWSKCDPLLLFDAPLETTYRSDLAPLERMLRTLASQCHVLILWLDCDREGEAIGDEVRSVCCAGNARLQVYRAKFSTVLPGEIQLALQTLGRVNENFVQAVQARSQLDLRVGAAFTRFQTLRLQRKFEGFKDQGVVSYGPCQFPTLGFVVERWARIETFVPEDFWFLELSIRVDPQEINEDAARSQSANTNNHTSSNRPILFTWKRGRLYDRIITLCLYEECLEANEAVVTQLEGRPKNKWRPIPLATVELQKRASRYLRIGSETLMTAADELYQAGYISYPRTETEKFRPEFNHQSLIQQLSSINEEGVGEYASRLLAHNNFQNPRAGPNDDQAHPPITPCKAVDPSTIADPTQRSVYKLVVKHYLACCSRDAIGRETTLSVTMGPEQFNAKGLMILERNWLEIYQPWERWSTGQGELPPLQVGSRIVPTTFVMKEGTTTAPNPLSEVELISLMDRNGIGTDATIAQHISTIQDRKYAIKDGNQTFLPTQLGIALVEGYNSMGYQLNKPDLRRETEAECNDIAAGRKGKEQVIAVLLAKMKQCFQVATQEAHKLDDAVARHFSRLGTDNSSMQVVNASFSECGACQSAMALKQELTVRSNARNGVRNKILFCGPCCNGWELPRGGIEPKTLSDITNGTHVLCPICNYQVLRVVRGEGYEGNGYTICPKCYNDPPVGHGGSQGGSQFRCFNCSHPTCSLATGSASDGTEVFPCPFCHEAGRAPPEGSGRVCLKTTTRGFVLSCTTYSGGRNCPYTIWLPKECQTVDVLTGNENQNSLCQQCSSGNRMVHQIHIKWKPGSVPPQLGRELDTCILCDVDLRSNLNISLPQQGQVRARPVRNGGGGPSRSAGRGSSGGTGRNSARGRGGRSRDGGRGGGGQSGDGNACFRCGEPGHYSSSCPNQ